MSVPKYESRREQYLYQYGCENLTTHNNSHNEVIRWSENGCVLPENLLVVQLSIKFLEF